MRIAHVSPPRFSSGNLSPLVPASPVGRRGELRQRHEVGLAGPVARTPDGAIDDGQEVLVENHLVPAGEARVCWCLSWCFTAFGTFW